MKVSVRKLLIVVAGVGGLVWVGAGVLADRALAEDPDAQALVPCDHPCPGWRYEVIYSPADGRIYGVGGYDPTDPFQPSDPDRGYVVRRGERVLDIEVLDITGHPDLVDIMRNLSAGYYVDLPTQQVRKKPTVALSIPSPRDGDAFGLWLALSAVAMAILGSASRFAIGKHRRGHRTKSEASSRPWSAGRRIAST
jgi:hypothetical protein